MFQQRPQLLGHGQSDPRGVFDDRDALVRDVEADHRAAQGVAGADHVHVHDVRHAHQQDDQHLLADAFEAIIAAIYLDGGIESARKFVLRYVVPDIENPKPKTFKDYKTCLQEIIQQNPEEHLEYILVGESGPDHNKHFVVEVHLNSNVIGKGGGKSKKEAEQQAAREALELMGY